MAGIHWNAPSATASEQPINTGVAAAAKVFGRAANIQALIEFVCMVSIIFCIIFRCKDNTSYRL
jgi:hypothetical protein